MSCRTLVIIAAIIGGWMQTTAQDLAGTAFTFAIPINFREMTQTVQRKQPEHMRRLAMTSAKTASVRIRAARAGFDTTLNVPADVTTTFDLPPDIMVERIHGPQKATVRIDASTPISVTYIDQKMQTTDAMTVWPDHALGTAYRLITRPQLSKDLLPTATITATQDETTVTIIPTSALSNGTRNKTPFSVSLRAGQTLFIESVYDSLFKSDLSGTLVTSDKPINVVTSHACAYVPSRIEACNVLLEQAPPIERWGTRYIVPPVPGRKAYTWQVVANVACTVRTDGASSTIAAGGIADHPNESVGRIIESTDPILVAYFGQGFRSGDSTGDPFMTIIPPVTAWTTEHDIALPIIKDWDVYCTVLGTKGALQATKVNGAPIDAASIVVIDDLAYAHVRITSDLVRVRSSEPVGTLVSASGSAKTFNAYDAYGLCGGWRVPKVSPAR